jgi:hypothetical protein
MLESAPLCTPTGRLRPGQFLGSAREISLPNSASSDLFHLCQRLGLPGERTGSLYFCVLKGWELARRGEGMLVIVGWRTRRSPE